jgi:hypothetical protein
MAKKKSTASKMGTAVKKAAKKVTKAAKKSVVRPVGKALGLTGRKKAGAKKR